jgi:hypothetical protein
MIEGLDMKNIAHIGYGLQIVNSNGEQLNAHYKDVVIHAPLKDPMMVTVTFIVQNVHIDKNQKTITVAGR